MKIVWNEMLRASKGGPYRVREQLCGFRGTTVRFAGVFGLIQGIFDGYSGYG